MKNAETCPECGSKLAPDAPHGICPKCLMARTLDADANATSAGSPFSGFEPPKVEELAKHFPQFDILEFLGRGGMGAVYRARQKALDRIVALKILPPAAGRDPIFAERFAREARTLARLLHPNIVTVFDVGQAGDYCYFVMEMVDGTSLREKIRSRQLTPPDSLALLEQICDALQYAHDKGVIHRDIKPENILLDREGRVKMADFGIAKLRDRSPGEVTLTEWQQSIGTLDYMAPEQRSQAGEVDHRADIYSLGVVLYEMLTGEVPMGIFALPSQKAGVNARLDQVVVRTLARQPKDRYHDVGELKTEIQNSLGGASGTREQQAPPPNVIVSGRTSESKQNPSAIPPTEPLPSKLTRKDLDLNPPYVPNEPVGSTTKKSAWSLRRRQISTAVAALVFLLAGGFWVLQRGRNNADAGLAEAPEIVTLRQKFQETISQQRTDDRSERIEALLKECIPLVRAREDQPTSWELLGEIALEANANWYGQVSARRIIELTGSSPGPPKLKELVKRIQKRGWFSEAESESWLSGPDKRRWQVELEVKRQLTKWGYIDRAGKVVIEPQYQAAGPLITGLAWVKLGGKYGFINNTGKVVIEPKYDSADTFVGDYCCVALNGKYGFINRSGKMVIEAKYDDTTHIFVDGLVGVLVSGKWGFINQRGKVVIQPQYENIFVTLPFSEGLAGVGTTNKMFFIDRSGKVVLEPQYEGFGRFSEGLAVVNQGEKFGFMDRSGKLIIELKYDDANPFREAESFAGGMASVRTWVTNSHKNLQLIQSMEVLTQGGPWVLIDQTGREISNKEMLVDIAVEPVTQRIDLLGVHLFRVSGWLDWAGEWVWRAPNGGERLMRELKRGVETPTKK